MSIILEFHGATEGVTGSCHQISFAKDSLLIDCGIFQGKEARKHSDLTITFDISNLKGLILTHAHLDHIGRLPADPRQRFQGCALSRHFGLMVLNQQTTGPDDVFGLGIE